MSHRHNKKQKIVVSSIQKTREENIISSNMPIQTAHTLFVSYRLLRQSFSVTVTEPSLQLKHESRKHSFSIQSRPCVNLFGS